jgi:FAD:protein FMN transferase
MSPATITDRFRSMGCATEVVIVDGPSDLRDLARHTIAQLEQRWSRFIATSDISCINHAGGLPVRVDPSTITLLQAMVEGWSITGGSFDPTLLVPLVGLGYDASWDNPHHVTSLSGNHNMRTPLDLLQVDSNTNTVQAPFGCCLDAGGIGKGLAADIAVSAILEAGAQGALVSIGGDLCVRGAAPQEGGWFIGVRDPIDDTIEASRVALLQGGLATSGPGGHAWVGPDQRLVHHLLDPATGDPLPVSYPNSVIEATVIAGTAAWAEVWTKAILVDGPTAAFPRLDDLGLGARAVFADGTITTNSAWHTYERALPSSPAAEIERTA